MLFSNPWFKVGIVVVGFAVGFASGNEIVNNIWQAKWDKAEKSAANNQLAAINAAVESYKTKLTNLQEIEHETRLALSNALLDAANANNANNSLQQQLSNYVRNASERANNATTTAERAAVATDFVVLTELFERANRRAEELAKVADENRIRGLACESSYNSLK